MKLSGWCKSPCLLQGLLKAKNLIIETIYLSHEFQHINQFVVNKRIYMYGCILKYYLVYKVIPLEELPLKYDAQRKSKIIAYNLCGAESMKIFSNWIFSDKNIQKKNKKKYIWIFFNSIDINKDYLSKNEA